MKALWVIYYYYYFLSFQMPLLEKAWAKLLGTYSYAVSMEGGLPNETLV